MQIEDAEQLKAAILEQFDGLSPRLQQIAQFILDDPHSMGVETLAVISERIGVHASAIVRFAKTFGFDGAVPMQRILKDRLLESQPESVYHRRAREFANISGVCEGEPYDLLVEFVNASSLSLNHLLSAINRQTFEAAVDLINSADTIYVSGFRRSFPVAAYFSYSLQQGGKRTVLVDGVGGLSLMQIGQIGSKDLIIGISFTPYAQETIELLQRAAKAGAASLVITDTTVSPVTRSATCAIQIRNVEARGFRTMSASMCVAQALAVAHAFRDEAGRPQSGKSKRSR
ncbi:MurR/RpiR family transcriptional regulator [Granulibacter bethesdensis]|uniref:MurR/RpiR family transcriptional regulator n=1 Tax=Granulibacter bethesdensis TaxID=364410 RepID=UPI000909816F|nr:MurR/RpiR family transcriptional regulator [Granulibacter bethesdensis]APH59442.1 Transcriptional regulator, RpiR family [Granulibacter bethesdensis]